MARNKAKDDILFNCDQEYELSLAANHYGVNKLIVFSFLREKCRDKLINHFSHLKIYNLIKEELGYEIPA